MTVGERTINGEIQPREDALAAYQVVTDTGQFAILVERQRPDLFTMNLANIAPGETIRVTLDVMLPVQVIDQQLQLNLPTTLTPRFINAATPDTQAITASFVQPETARGPRLDVTLKIDPPADYASVSSQIHTLEKSETGLMISNTAMERSTLVHCPINTQNPACGWQESAKR